MTQFLPPTLLLPLLLLLSLIGSFSMGWFFPTIEQDLRNHLKMPAPITVSPLPDFAQYKNVSKKKKQFFNYLLPLIKHANNEIRAERHWLLAFKEQTDISQEDMNQLLTLADKYEVSTLKPNQILKALIKRVDIIPPSLALAQAANESAWGTSRFAISGNNLFGQWCYVKGCGLVPLEQVEGQHYEVAKFDNVLDSIRSYMRNLNTHYTYKSLRTNRQILRESGQLVTGLSLTEDLIHYSTRRQHYVMEIEAMILHNKLGKHDIKPKPVEK